jgi:DNA-binding response OmpR family regulator
VRPEEGNLASAVRKVDAPGQPKLIGTVRGAGYTLKGA